jgi:hypothetical protein
MCDCDDIYVIKLPIVAPRSSPQPGKNLSKVRVRLWLQVRRIDRAFWMSRISPAWQLVPSTDMDKGEQVILDVAFNTPDEIPIHPSTTEVA